MLLNNFATEFVSLFTGMHWVVALLLCAGIALCIIEAVVPGFGIFGIFGILSAIGGIVTHAIISGSVLQVFFLVLLVMVVVGLLFLLFIHSAKYGLLAKSALVENKSSIPADFKEKTVKELSSLIGQEGLTLTECKPVGKIRVGQNTYEAQAKSAIIKKGEVIKVISIEDARIIIDKLTY